MRGESIESGIEHGAVPLQPEQVRLVLERVAVIERDKDDGRRWR